ncbi:MAG: hypothetical protein KGL39_39745 [Patescibacteria group bacterium]|nr:hypothetical protein [Patescibacteria group bacterium]
MKLDDEIKDGVCILIAFVLLVGMLVLIFSGCAWPGADQHEHDKPWPIPGTNGEYRP